MNNLPECPPEETRQRKVLTEKYRSDRLWMLDWIKEQKNKTAINQQYEEAGKWRDFERTFYKIEENEENHHIRPQFDDFFSIFMKVYNNAKP